MHLPKFIHRYFFIPCCIIFFSSFNKTAAQTERFSFEKFIQNGDTLNYRILYPDYDTMRAYPLVIFLHGAGERGNDNAAQLKWGVMNYATDKMMLQHPAIIVAPQCPLNQSWANFGGQREHKELQLQATPSKQMQLVIGLIHDLMKNKMIDTNRIYITGLSMGGYGTYDAIERYPNLFAAAIPVAGGGDTSKAALIAHIPIWDFCGAEDAAVDPRYSQEMIMALIKQGAHPGFTQYPEVGHFSWLGAYTDEQAMEWLFRQHK